ncbi:MAG: YheU family protein [Chlorobium sp.]|nr:YheU family protein [Chlorobium sp.]
MNPESLRKMVEEFVTREWSDLSDAEYTFEDNIA